MQDYNKLFNTKMGELMQAVQFPKEEIPEEFAGSVEHCLLHHNPTSLECSIDEFERVYHSALQDNDIWFMPQMFIALSVVKNVTPFQRYPIKQNEFVTNEISLWISEQRTYQSMSATWDTIAAPYIEQARKYVNEVSKRDEREAQAKGRIMQLNGKPANA